MTTRRPERSTSGPLVVYPRPRRALAIAPYLASRVCAPLLLAAVAMAADPPITPPDLAILFALFVALPAIIAWAIRTAHRGWWRLAEERLVIERRGEVVEIPLDAIDTVEPWRLPLPAPGVSLRTRAGRRFELEDCGADLLDSLADALAGSGAGDRIARAAKRAVAVYARAKRAKTPPRWYHLVGKFPLFALLPTAPLFNVHQYIAYGGTFGEYYLLGLRAYLTTFAAYWSGVTILLISFAGIWRWIVELIALLAAALAPPRAAAVRAWSERAAAILYYGGALVAVGLRFWPW